MATQINTRSQHEVTPAPAFSEAPASINVFVQSPAGFTYQLTMRASKVSEVLTQAATLESWLTTNGWTPAPTRQALPTGNTQASQSADDTPHCAIHNKPMTRRTKDGRSWWSCSERLSDRSYCPYRPKQ
jgi:hypothetical protein